MPFDIPIPPSPATSKALLAAFAERGITFVPNRLVRALDPVRRMAVLDDLSDMPYNLFLGFPKHCVPDVVATSGMTIDGWISVDPMTFKTRFPSVYAVGDVTSVGTPKAGVFAKGAARTVAAEIIAHARGDVEPSAYRGLGSCYVEFGEERVGRVDVEFLAGLPTGSFVEPSIAMVAEKLHFGSSRRTLVRTIAGLPRPEQFVTCGIVSNSKQENVRLTRASRRRRSAITAPAQVIQTVGRPELIDLK